MIDCDEREREREERERTIDRYIAGLDVGGMGGQARMEVHDSFIKVFIVWGEDVGRVLPDLLVK